jgi:hypothetical protein
MTVQSPVLVARGEDEHFHFLDTVYTAKISSEQSLGAVTVMEFLAPRPAGSSPRRRGRTLLRHRWRVVDHLRRR